MPVSARAIRTRAADYLAGTDPADPLVSPIFADLSGLPPLLIQAGSHQVLLDDATRLAVKAAADDVAVILEAAGLADEIARLWPIDEGGTALDLAVVEGLADKDTDRALWAIPGSEFRDHDMDDWFDAVFCSFWWD